MSRRTAREHGADAIRAARSDERDVLLAIWRSAVGATHRFLTAADLDELEAAIRDVHLRALDLSVVVDVADVPYAFMGSSGARIEMLFVRDDARGTGAGSALIAQAKRRRDALELDVNEQNPAAREFYRRRGFHELGRSAVDGAGRPFPVFHLRWERPGSSAHSPSS